MNNYHHSDAHGPDIRDVLFRRTRKVLFDYKHGAIYQGKHWMLDVALDRDSRSEPFFRGCIFGLAVLRCDLSAIRWRLRGPDGKIVAKGITDRRGRFEIAWDAKLAEENPSCSFEFRARRAPTPDDPEQNESGQRPEESTPATNEDADRGLLGSIWSAAIDPGPVGELTPARSWSVRWMGSQDAETISLAGGGDDLAPGFDCGLTHHDRWFTIRVPLDDAGAAMFPYGAALVEARTGDGRVLAGCLIPVLLDQRTNCLVGKLELAGWIPSSAGQPARIDCEPITAQSVAAGKVTREQVESLVSDYRVRLDDSLREKVAQLLRLVSV